ncbi:MAG TPA: lysylphosphatidylglycerol synthase transmembrane domain-containing protein [Solirubrobacteraceae bacterium]|nr:lysylphosphatidylglycerol synthase transmembrane domain-containing protein [Solirubrobacteraceae bacterium]
MLSVLAGTIVLAVPGLGTVADRLEHVDAWWAALAVMLELASCGGYVIVFRLVFADTPRRAATGVAWAEMAFGAVVPVGGAGGIGLGAWMLHQRGEPLERIADQSTVLFWVTSAVNVAALILAGFCLGLRVLSGPHEVLLTTVPAAACVLVIAGFVALPAATRRVTGPGRLRALSRATGATVSETEALLRDGSWRLLGAVAYLGCDMAVLWVSFRTFGRPPPAAALVLAYLIGYMSNMIPIPVPGGIGVLDTGLLGALVLYGSPAAPAAAAVLLYHAIALWLPTAGGTIGFLRARRDLIPAADGRDPLPHG